MSGKINKAAGEKDSVKISKLGEELGVDPREIAAAAKDMAMDNAKVPASWVSSGQADRLRAKFGGNKDLKAQLERKRRFLESGKLEVVEKPPEVETKPVKLSPEAYESDRRSTFGVIQTPGGVRVDIAPPKGLHAKPAVSGITRPAPLETSVPDTTHATVSDSSAIAAQPPKKFIGIEVAPPVRRGPAENDPRFGVVQAAPETEKTAPTAPNMELWGKLNDGRAPVELHTPREAIETLQPIEEFEAEIPEPVQETHAPVAKAPPHSRVEEAPAPSSQSGRGEKVESVLLPPKIHEVPVKMQPKHKAFGAKHKVKHKHSKHLADSKSRSDNAQHESKARAPKEQHHRAAPLHVEKKHSERKPKQADGLLKRFAKKWLGK